MPRIKTVLSPAWTTDWMTDEGKAKLARVRHRAAGRQGVAPRAVRRGRGRLSALRLGQYRAHFRIRLDRLQGAVALQGLRRAVRLFQVHLRRPDYQHGRRIPPAESRRCAARDAGCGVDRVRGAAGTDGRLSLQPGPASHLAPRLRRRGRAALLFDLQRARRRRIARRGEEGRRRRCSRRSATRRSGRATRST